MLNRDEFVRNLLDNINEMYDAYVNAEEKGIEISQNDDNVLPNPDEMLSFDDLPNFKASDPVISDEERDKMIKNLEKSTATEKIVFSVGKTALAIAVKTIKP